MTFLSLWLSPRPWVTCVLSRSVAFVGSTLNKKPSRTQLTKVRCQSSLVWPPRLGGGYRFSDAPEEAPPWYAERKNRLCLVDAMGYIHRIHHANQDSRLRTSSDEDTTILYGFLLDLLGILEMQPTPTHMVVVFDALGLTFRHDTAVTRKYHVDDVRQFIEIHGNSKATAEDSSESLHRNEIYPAYKGQRQETPPEILEAVPKVIEVLNHMNIKVVQVHGVEADDVCGTLGSRAVSEGMLALIFTLDTDFFQLLQPNLMLVRGPSRGAYKLHTDETFTKEYPGLVPKQFIDLRALSGDTSDNIPGVRGVGAKTALKLIQDHQDVEGVIEGAKCKHIKESKRIQDLFTESGWNAARISRKLIEIQTNLHMPDVRFELDECCLRRLPDNGEMVFKSMAHYEIQHILHRLSSVFENWEQKTAQ